MNKRRVGIVAVVSALALLLVPMGPAVADTTGLVVFTDGKATVQCAPQTPGGPTGLGFPGLKINKGKKCIFDFSSGNPHKNNMHTCIGLGASNTVKKGSKKPNAAVGGITVGKAVSTCVIDANGILGPKFKTPLPPPLQGGGPWCGGSHGISGAGSISIGGALPNPPGGTLPSKTINFDSLRYQSNGTLIVVTARGFKNVVQGPPDPWPGQSGPVLAIVNARPDEHKIAQGRPNTSCLTGNKNFKVSGVALALLLGNK